MTGFRFGAHPGCHSIRPSRLGRPDDAENPVKLDDLINWIGAQAVDYPGKIDCCGSSLASASGKTVMEIAGDKLKTVKGTRPRRPRHDLPLLLQSLRQQAEGNRVNDRRQDPRGPSLLLHPAPRPRHGAQTGAAGPRTQPEPHRPGARTNRRSLS